MKYLIYACVAALSLLSSESDAQDKPYPSRPITLIVAWPAGGSVDTVARLIAEPLRVHLGQPVLIVNRGGAVGTIGANVVAKAAPDGHTLLLTPPPPLTINRHLFSKMNFDSMLFSPISQIYESANALLVANTVPIDSMQQLLRYAKENPGKLTYGSPGAGSTGHLAAEMLSATAEVKFTHIPFNGTGPALVAVLGGHIDLMFSELSAALPQIKSGKVKAIAVSSFKRNPSLPDVPAISETLAGFSATTSGNLVGPPNMPASVVNKISLAVSDVLHEPEVMKMFLNVSAIPIGSTPQEMAQILKTDSDKWGKVIKSVGVKLD
jgi:tripartite-type tricarboxylate transporter receptor subunit TctC